MRFCEPIARHIVDEIALILVRPGTEEPLDRRPKRQMRPSFNNSWLTGLRLGLVQAGPSADSLLTTLSGLRRQRLEAEMSSRLLVAYGREFVRPRRYRLIDLAGAAGMSSSGIRTAYGDDEIDQVAKALARKPHPFPEIVYERHARSYGGGLLGQ